MAEQYDYIKARKERIVNNCGDNAHRWTHYRNCHGYNSSLKNNRIGRFHIEHFGRELKRQRTSDKHLERIGKGKLHQYDSPDRQHRSEHHNAALLVDGGQHAACVVEAAQHIAVEDIDPLASENAVTRQQLRELPLVVTSRTALRGEIEEWLKFPVSELDVVATMNLIDNAAPLAERGIACVLCVEGAVDMFDPARFAFRPLTPELSMTSVLAWKKLSPYSGAAGIFLEYIKTIHSEHTKV